jgi:hypothetical protein
VVAWNYTNSRDILKSRIPIPTILHKRLSIDWKEKDNLPPLPRANPKSSHWLDRLEQGIQAHIQRIQLQQERLAANARPPQPVLNLVKDDPDAVKLGAGLNKAYGAALNLSGSGRSARLERAKLAVEDYLAHFPPERRGAILLGALVHVYSNETGGADTAAWLGKTKGETKTDSIAHQTIEALRAIGMLDEILVTKEGLVVYASDSPPLNE